MRYIVKIIPKAEKDLDAIKGSDFDNLRKKILALSANPRTFGCQKLTLEEGYRVRYGDFRILYRIDDDVKEVTIYRIKHRREAYR